MGGVVSGPRNVIDGVNARLDRNGGRLTPFAAWLLLAGVKTLPLRMERHCASAQAIAELLASDDAVSLVRYPGLDAHPGHAAAARMCGSRHGGLLTFEFRAGEPAVRAFTNALELATIAVSLGEASTLVWPNGGGQVRLAVGLEDTDDLLDDVGRGLRAAREVTGTIGH
jgi:cystathionine beta-lyase/cystathionine gamma-synthase